MILIVMITILISRTNLRQSKLTMALSLVLILAACGGATTSEGNLDVVATTSIWGDVAESIVGDDATVEVLIPNGSDSHDYEATPQQVAAIQDADLVIANGLGLEEGLHDVLEGAETDGANIYEVGEDLDPLPFADHAHGEDDDGDEHDDDPHVWFDPQRMATAAELIADRLTEIDSSIDWASRAADYATELENAGIEVAHALGALPLNDRKLVTNHEALGYFANRYGFEVIGVVIPGGSTLADPSSAEMAALVEEIEHEGISTIFAETTQPTRLAESVAAEVGGEVEVVELFTESLGEPGSGAETLIEMLITNATRISDALS